MSSRPDFRMRARWRHLVSACEV